MDSDWVEWTSGSTSKEDFYQHFVKYCSEKHITPWSKDRLGKAIFSRYVEKNLLHSAFLTFGDKREHSWTGIKCREPMLEERYSEEGSESW
jgi:hypothetical protein